MTCHFFDTVYFLAILNSLLLVVSGIVDFNDLIRTGRLHWHNFVQDAFFVCLGVVALHGSLWITASFSLYWQRFIQRINELPQFLLTHPAAHAGLVSYFKTAEVAYTLYGVAVTSKLMYRIVVTSAQIMAVVLFVYNWQHMPHPEGNGLPMLGD